jgi:hypothetical protein
MSLDLTRLHDAIGKVADLAQDHAELQRAHGDVVVLAAQHKAELEQAQKDVDDMVALLIDAATTPAEKAGLTAVASIIVPAVEPVDVPVEAPVDPVMTGNLVTPMLPMVSPVAPVAPVVTGTFLPGDPRAR